MVNIENAIGNVAELLVTLKQERAIKDQQIAQLKDQLKASVEVANELRSELRLELDKLENPVEEETKQ